MNEADVHCIVTYAHAFRPGAGRTDHQIVLAQIEGLKGPRIERREVAKIAIRAGNARQQRDMHPLARDQIADRAFVVERGEDRRLRPGARDVRKDALGATALI